MSDLQYRTAERNWLSTNDHYDWCAFLQESRRIGHTIFTAAGLESITEVWRCRSCGNRVSHYDATCHHLVRNEPSSFPHVCGSTDIGSTGMLWDFKHTDDGFIAEVRDAILPALEQVYEEESYPIWDWWSGYVKVAWSDVFGPPCPTLFITVTDSGHQPAGEIPAFVYEGDCVTSQEQLAAAFEDAENWNY